MRRTARGAAVLAIMLPLLPAVPLMAVGQPAAQNATAPDPVGFVTRASENGLFELAIARLAVARSKDSDIMRFGNDVTRVFNGANGAIAGAAGDIAPPRALNAADQALFDGLQGADDAAFNATYLQLQRQSLDAAAALYRGFASSGLEGPLRQVAERYASDLARLQEALGRIEATRPATGQSR